MMLSSFNSEIEERTVISAFPTFECEDIDASSASMPSNMVSLLVSYNFQFCLFMNARALPWTSNIIKGLITIRLRSTLKTLRRTGARTWMEPPNPSTRCPQPVL